jgi:hypothetical protein
MSESYARKTCLEFDAAIINIYKKEFLRLPTAADLQSIDRLHKFVHGVSGMLGSLDCTHTYWKNCPKAWHGSYVGKEGQPSIVMEAVSDHHLYIWHAAYGYTGTMNDLIILNLSPLLERMVDGTLEALEKEAGIVPYQLSGEEFTKSFLLVDGIYPKWSRFVRGMKEPATHAEKAYTAWQEGARKDIERAFGVMKIVWQWLDRPILIHNLEEIQARVTTLLILHNILVTDRVMDSLHYDFRQRYDPAAYLDDEEFVYIEQPTDLQRVQNRSIEETTHGASVVGVTNVPERVRTSVTRSHRWKDLKDSDENTRLHKALMRGRLQREAT